MMRIRCEREKTCRPSCRSFLFCDQAAQHTSSIEQSGDRTAPTNFIHHVTRKSLSHRAGVTIGQEKQRHYFSICSRDWPLSSPCASHSTSDYHLHCFTFTFLLKLGLFVALLHYRWDLFTLPPMSVFGASFLMSVLGSIVLITSSASLYQMSIASMGAADLQRLHRDWRLRSWSLGVKYFRS